ncbi:MAG: cytochrome c [Deltaproteobacteria bacterium]|nr:cytochrome c [Deltaproteobacteria bacterium]
MPRSWRPVLAVLGVALALGGAAHLWSTGLRLPSAAERIGGDDPELRLGRQQLQHFCLACHTLDGSPEVNPLAPKVRGWTRDQAYRNVARLDELSSAMLVNFSGTDEERRALALVLERLGKER